MSELQTEESAALPTADTHEPTETVDSGSDLAPDSQGEGESKPQNEESEQDKTQKAINRQTKKFYDEKRLRVAAEARIEGYEQKERDAQLNTPAPTTLAIPDPYGENYEQDMAKYTASVQTVAAHNSQQTLIRQAQEMQQQQTLQKEQAEIAEVGQAFFKNAEASGITAESLNKAIETLNGYGMPQDLGLDIMKEADAGVIVEHLAANPSEFESLIRANRMQFGEVYAGIKAKAAALKPKQTNAPDPALALSGSGTDPDANQYKYIGGSTIDHGTKW